MTLLVNGLLLAHRVRLLVRSCLCGHLELGAGLPKGVLMPLVHGLMLLKTIEAAFHARLGWVARHGQSGRLGGGATASGHHGLVRLQPRA